MKEPLTIISYDNCYPNQYPNVPELMAPSPINNIPVREGRYVVTDRLHTLSSEGFTRCSGIVMKGEAGLAFGLLHALPTQDLYPDDLEKLKSLAGGQLMLIEGSISRPKDWILRDLSDKLGIKHVDTMTVDTVRPQVGNMHFHIVFRPESNEFLIARNSHLDLQVYRAFE